MLGIGVTQGGVEPVSYFVKTVKEGISHELTCEQRPEGSEEYLGEGWSGQGKKTHKGSEVERVCTPSLRPQYACVCAEVRVQVDL